jgi:hypothetical protein
LYNLDYQPYFLCQRDFQQQRLFTISAADGYIDCSQETLERKEDYQNRKSGYFCIESLAILFYSEELGETCVFVCLCSVLAGWTGYEVYIGG